MHTKRTLALMAAVTATMCFADTGIRLAVEDSSQIHGRTVDCSRDLELGLSAIPKGSKLGDVTTKLGIVGITAFHSDLIDGINEAGLSVGALLFPGYAKYSRPQNKATHNVAPTKFAGWLLANCASLEEVRDALKDLCIIDVPDSNWGDHVVGLHWVVYDASGASIVIEPAGDELHVYNNPLGVIANAPRFDWHMTNLVNYLNLSVYNVPEKHIENMQLKPFGSGSGLVGLPGDFSSPSRFVRAAILCSTAILPQDSPEACRLGFQLLSNLAVVPGAVREQEGQEHYVWTQAMILRDPHNMRYIYRDSAHDTPVAIDVKRVLSKIRRPHSYKLPTAEDFKDISTQLILGTDAH